MRSLRGRLLATMAAVLAVVLTALVLVSTRITRFELRRYTDLVVERPSPLEPVRRALEERYRASGSWAGADETAASLAGRVHHEILAVDEAGRVVARSRGLTGARLLPSAAGSLRLEWAAPGQARKLLLVHAPGLPVSDAAGKRVGSAYAIALHPGDGGPPGPPDLAGSVNRPLTIAVAVAGLLALALTAALSRRVLGPIGALTAAARRMEHGDRDARVNAAGGATARDEIGELARSFNSMAEAISKNEALRRALVGDVAHELRTPLTSMRAQLESIQDGLAKPDGKTIDSLHEDVLLLGRLVDDLQELALAESGQLALHLERLPVAEAIARAAAAVASPAAAAGVVVEDRSEAGLPPALADRGRVAQILANLLSNAITHTPAGGRIGIAAASKDNAIEISVSDTGAGIAPEHLPHVFDRFYRADPSRSRSTGGSGLGLAIVRQLVRAQGGGVRVESAPGRGSVFSFTIPAAPPERPEPGSAGS